MEWHRGPGAGFERRNPLTGSGSGARVTDRRLLGAHYSLVKGSRLVKRSFEILAMLMGGSLLIEASESESDKKRPENRVANTTVAARRQ